jgi:NDP-mannose synthase
METTMHAVILAGGKGVRLRPYTTRLPKPLVPIGEEHSILEIALNQLSHVGFTDVTLAISHFGDLIRSYIGDGSRWRMNINYTGPEEVPLGTLGPVLAVRDQLPDHFLVMNGDILTDLDYADLMRCHDDSGAPLTIATYRREVRIDYGVLTAKDGRIAEFTEKPAIDYRVSMGVYACSKPTLMRYTPGLPFGFDELVLDLLARGTPPADYAFDGYWFDIGRPEDYDRANAEFGVIRRSLLRET